MTWEPNRRYRYKCISRTKMLRKLVSSHKMIFNIYIRSIMYTSFYQFGIISRTICPASL